VDDLNQRGFIWSCDDRLTAIIGVVLLALLFLARQHSYLLFHTLAEIVFIVVCLSVLVIAWSLRQFLDDDFAVFLGVALWIVAVLQILHVLDYPGLGLISNSPDAPTQVWLGARLLLAASFVAAILFVGRRVRVSAVLACFVGYAGVLLASVYWWHVFPVAQSANGELTAFGKVCESVVCVLLALAMILLWRKRDRLPPQTWQLLLTALAVSIVAELWFTILRVEGTWQNLVGHLFLWPRPC
jgi:hypothetical protein